MDSLPGCRTTNRRTGDESAADRDRHWSTAAQNATTIIVPGGRVRHLVCDGPVRGSPNELGLLEILVSPATRPQKWLEEGSDGRPFCHVMAMFKLPKTFARSRRSMILWLSHAYMV